MSDFLQHIKTNGKKIDEEIAAIFAKYGIKVAGRSARVDASEGKYTFKIQYATTEGVAALNKKAEDNFRFYAKMEGMEPDWFGKSFRMGGKTYKITGFNPKKHKKPVELTSDGKTYLGTPEQVTAFMKISPVV